MPRNLGDSLNIVNPIYRMTLMTHTNLHPDTGRVDPVREDSDWADRLADLEYTLGYTVCGVRCSTTGLPCMRRPPKGEHRCLAHARPTPTKLVDPENPKAFPYSPNTKWGMSLNMFTVCRLCKQGECMYRVVGERQSLPVIGKNDDGSDIYANDNCPIEQSIYDDVMTMAREYGLNDSLQDSMLESVAFAFIHKYRAERIIAQEGMVLESVVGFTRSGDALHERKEHPLLKHVLKIDDTIIKFSDALEFSPKAQSRKKVDEEGKTNERDLIAALIQSANTNRRPGELPLVRCLSYGKANQENDTNGNQ